MARNVALDGAAVQVRDPARFRERHVEPLLRKALERGDPAGAAWARRVLLGAAAQLGCGPASLRPLCELRARGGCGGFTIPVLPMREPRPARVRAALRAARRSRVGLVIFEARGALPAGDLVCLVAAAALQEAVALPIVVRQSLTRGAAGGGAGVRDFVLRGAGPAALGAAREAADLGDAALGVEVRGTLDRARARRIVAAVPGLHRLVLLRTPPRRSWPGLGVFVRTELGLAGIGLPVRGPLVPGRLLDLPRAEVAEATIEAHASRAARDEAWYRRLYVGLNAQNTIDLVRSLLRFAPLPG
jgi:hypothetical protein